MPGEPRAARWYKVICKMDKSVVNAIFLSGQCFQWRPYAADINNWNHSSYYRAKEHLAVDSERNSDQNLQCCLICMTMCYFVGLDFQERYMPHRVAISLLLIRIYLANSLNWSFVPKMFIFFVPPKSLEPSVSLTYFYWWKKSEFICGGKLPNVLRRSLVPFNMPSGGGEMRSKNYHTPSVTTRLKDNETVSRSSIKDEVIEVRDEEWEFGKWNNNFDVLFKPVSESDFPTREAGSLERRSPPIKEVKGGSSSYTSATSFDSGSSECSTPCSFRFRTLVSITRELSPTQRFQDSFPTDHFAVRGTPIKMAKDSKEIDDNPPSESKHRANGWNSIATSDEVHLNKTIGKRKFTSTEEGSDCKETIPIMNGNTDELQGDCVNATMNVDDRNFQIQIMDLEKRIEKLEKQIGTSPDRG